MPTTRFQESVHDGPPCARLSRHALRVWCKSGQKTMLAAGTPPAALVHPAVRECKLEEHLAEGDRPGFRPRCCPGAQLAAAPVHILAGGLAQLGQHAAAMQC